MYFSSTHPSKIFQLSYRSWLLTRSATSGNETFFIKKYLLFIGIAIIINNMTFFKVPNDRESKAMPPRTGTDRDAGNTEYRN